MGNRFYIVDVFAEEKYTGNQLAVIRDAGTLPGALMQKIAREMNYSETTFILSDAPVDGGYDVRIFTPERELPFAGHPTLGTAYIIRNEIMAGDHGMRAALGESIALNLKVGRIPVTFRRAQDGVEESWMKQMPPCFGKSLDPAPVIGSLGLDMEDCDLRFPVQEVSTGLPFIIAPLKSLQAVRRARVRRDKFREIIAKTGAKDILIFCPETYHTVDQLNVRVFTEYEGVPEDPATGSANGCLAGYLVEHRYFGSDKIDIRVEQGYEIGRPSLLLLKAEKRGDAIDVFVGGKVVMVARGELV